MLTISLLNIFLGSSNTELLATIQMYKCTHVGDLGTGHCACVYLVGNKKACLAYTLQWNNLKFCMHLELALKYKC